MIFVGVHVAGIMFDSYVSFGLVDVLVPFAASWHPLWVAWGIVSMYLLLAIELTSLTRRWLPKRVWRRTHILSLPLFALATVHFIVAGTDAGNPFALAGIAICSLAVLGLLFRRIERSRAVPPQPVRVRIPETIGSPGT